MGIYSHYFTSTNHQKWENRFVDRQPVESIDKTDLNLLTKKYVEWYKDLRNKYQSEPTQIDFSKQTEIANIFIEKINKNLQSMDENKSSPRLKKWQEGQLERDIKTTTLTPAAKTQFKNFYEETSSKLSKH